MEDLSDNPKANQQINIIKNLINKGLSDDDIAATMQDRKELNLQTNSVLWTGKAISNIRKNFGLSATPQGSLPSLQKTIVKNYVGKHAEATSDFQKDSAVLAERGYNVTGQNWIQNSWGCGSFLIALALCIILIGFLIFIYMLIVKPSKGTLTVTYELKNPQGTLEYKTCPQCAEDVKLAARVCRFCGHSFE